MYGIAVFVAKKLHGRGPQVILKLVIVKNVRTFKESSLKFLLILSDY